LDKNIRTVMPELPNPALWIDYLAPAISENWYTNFGPVNKNFEYRLEMLYGRPDESVVTSSNATSGLSACLIAEAISGPVLCPAFTFQATASSIYGANCKPVIVDVDATLGIVTPDALEAGFNKTGAQAAIVIAPYGITTDFHAHEAVCQRMDKLLIIDNAAGLGVARSHLSFSGVGDLVREVYSLHATKPYGIGEGCAIFAPKSKVSSLRAAMNFGLQSHSVSGNSKAPYWGINGKMSEFHAAIGLAVADTMAHRVAARQNMASNWIACIEKTSATIFSKAIKASPWQVFPILLESQDQVLATIENAAARNIELRRYYSPSLGACKGMEQVGPCPNARSLAERALVLPVRSNMDPTDQANLMKIIEMCINKCDNGALI
jgi:dTDP-4-amino-4,6-dideoxygalactose transaminase